MSASPETALIGVFGGTFDPVHLGHLHAARTVQRRLGIEDFRFVPAGDPPHRGATFAAARHRLAMLRLALREWPEASIDERELHRPGPSWMVETLESLRRDHPDRPLLLIIGQDSANSLDRWHRWRELFDLAHLVVMTRPGQAPAYAPELGAIMQARRSGQSRELRRSAAGRVLPLEVSPLDLSSTAVRRAVAGHGATGDMLPGSVARYIREHGLYRAGAAL